jgi:hypothetical protein
MDYNQRYPTDAQPLQRAAMGIRDYGVRGTPFVSLGTGSDQLIRQPRVRQSIGKRGWHGWDRATYSATLSCGETLHGG